MGFHQPWKPRLMKCWAHCAFSAPIFWITYRFWNMQEIILWSYCDAVWTVCLSFAFCNSLNCALLYSPVEAVSQRRWRHLTFEPGRVSLGLREEAEVLAWSHRCTGSLPAAWAKKKHSQCFIWLHKIQFCRMKWVQGLGGLTDWERMMPSISTAGTCCIGFNALYCSVSWST